VNELELTLAINDYDHTRDLVTGRVRVEGVRLRTLELSPPEINGRFSLYREWDVSEFGLGKYLAQRAAGDDSIVAIPVFPARSFRHASIYVATDSPLRALSDLAGRRVGIPEWAQTAVTYVRGLMVREHAVDLASIDWHQAGVSQPGRTEKVAVRLPDGVRVTPHPDRTLERLLADGDIDAVISAQPPDAFVARDPGIRRLYADPRSVDEASYRATGIYPIMHTVALRRPLLEAHPWVAIELWKGFEVAKRRSQERMLDGMMQRTPLPWATAAAEEARALFGDDFFPYGIEPNRVTLDAVLDFAYDQGVASRRLAVEDLFWPTTHRALKS
jgi:4,5-dihydroxyphthalate decarboxylase